VRRGHGSLTEAFEDEVVKPPAFGQVNSRVDAVGSEARSGADPYRVPP